MLAEFKRGTTPASLGLGDGCSQPACARLLVSLGTARGACRLRQPPFSWRSRKGSNKICADWDAHQPAGFGQRVSYPPTRQISAAATTST